jgi:hypothetical protein
MHAKLAVHTRASFKETVIGPKSLVEALFLLKINSDPVVRAKTKGQKGAERRLKRKSRRGKEI